MKNLICAEWSREDVDNAEDGWELVVRMGSSQLDALDRSWRYLFASPRVFFLDSFSLCRFLHLYDMLISTCHFSPFVSKWDLIAITCIWTIYILLNSLGGFWGGALYCDHGGRESCFVLDYPSVVTYCYIFLLVIPCFHFLSTSKWFIFTINSAVELNYMN